MPRLWQKRNDENKEAVVSEETVKIAKLGNGMTLVAEPMGEVSSGAFVILVPAGAAYDPAGRTGTAGVLGDLVFRGAGQMDNRTLNDRLDGLGLHQSSGTSAFHSHFSGSLVADNLEAALELYGEILQRPMLLADQFELCRELAIQTLDSLEDDPHQKLSMLVREQYLPYPAGRPALGKRAELLELQAGEVKEYYGRCYGAEGTILAAAGKVDWKRLKETVERIFGGWKAGKVSAAAAGRCQSRYYHENNQGSQVHIGLIYPSVNYRHPDYYKALAAANVLSGGMGSRLFTEVREKRGLCYSVSAGHQVVGEYGMVQCYLGSTPERAQEGLDVLVGELRKLGEGITQDELDRAKVGLRASLIMQGESSGARAMACARDYYQLGRVRSLDEIDQAIQKLTVGEVLEHVRRYPPKDFAAATIGPKELKVHLSY